MRITHWDQKSSTEDTNEILFRLASYHSSQIKESDTREYLVACITRNDILALCDYSPDYDKLSVSDAANVRQVTAFFSKRCDIEVGIDKRRAAVNSFIAAESLCRQTNSILKMKRRGEFFYSPRVEPVLLHAQRKIASILGDVPNLSELKVRFGPGATTQVQKRMASAKRKLSQKFACSEDLLPVAKQCLEELAGWVFADSADTDQSKLVDLEIHSSRLSFVPKNYKTFRSVGVEPSLNTMFQAGIGSYISRRLRNFGIDIRDQTRNRILAKEGSITGELATLDLSSASDTIATELVYELLPVDWAVFLDQFRTRAMTVEGYTFQQEKFCSMGNGFTFPLETLIFYALAYGCSVDDTLSEKVSVYGDDIIIPTSRVPLMREVLTACGFMLNVEKSCFSGKFRESCGADYLSGFDIRPSYIKDALSGFDIFRLHNQYVRRLDYEAAAIVLEYLDPSLKKWGPDGYGDGHLIGDVPMKPYKRNLGWCGYVFETYTFKAKKDFTVLPGDRVYPSYCTYVKEDEGENPSSLDTYALRFEAGLPAHQYDRVGRLGVSIPGRSVANLIKIYVLCA